MQKNLAKSLELIAEHGPDAFYKGAIADQIADEMKKNGGLITKVDLAEYKAVERTPISGEYRGYQVYSMPPPSSGGIHIVQILNILENFDMHKFGFGSADAMLMRRGCRVHYCFFNLGGALGIIAVLLRQEFLLVIMAST